MFKCMIENKKNNVITLTQDENNYQVLNIVGLNPPNAQINTSSIANMDGSKFNSSKLSSRNIVITIKINGNIEENRIKLYKYFSTKEWCKFYYKNEHRNVFIECYVESFECDLFSSDETAQISLQCPYPYFKDVQEIIDDISKALSSFAFPFSIGSKDATNPSVLKQETTDNAIPFSVIDMARITNVYNNSESETGVIIEIEVLSPVSIVQIRNTETGDVFTVEYDFIENDRVTINTNKSQKSINLLRNGIESNLFTSIRKGSKFFQLEIGDNFFGYTADDGESDDAIHIIFRHYNAYRGV